MTIFQSQITLNTPVSAVYDFLADCNNHEQLMPENIYNWSSTRDEASFTIQNMAKLVLQIEERLENERITIKPKEKAPFEVTLRWTLEAKDNHDTLASFVVEADLNMMMKMLAAKPLQKLVDHQVQALESILG